MGAGGKEGKHDGRCGGWHRQMGGGEGERCVNWQQTDRWKMRGVVCARCVGSAKESIMGCRLT